MFPLSDLSILFTALLIIGTLCLGLIVLVALMINTRRCKLVCPPVRTALPIKNEENEKATTPQLTISDWVAFLTSEKFGSTGIVLNVSAVLAALVALIYAVGTQTLWSAILDGIFVITVTVWILVKIFRPAGKVGRRAEKILKDVMSGKYNNAGDIQKAWLDNQG